MNISGVLLKPLLSLILSRQNVSNYRMCDYELKYIKSILIRILLHIDL